ncbi:hypothetical protein [endosymbiont of Lamellibrachia barhami]|uniref:hypothetical protein n=1 Tax=endosymbiont of Lamellibrachia barhami TaxID=205975 RepID=UPI0015B263FC|nr:hypothetical protein [endosymbiont of Lamellibrachia barhami]
MPIKGHRRFIDGIHHHGVDGYFVAYAKPALRLQRTKQKKVSKRRSKATKARRKGSEEKRCWAKRKKLEKVEKRLRTGYKASQSDKLHRQQADYEDYLKQFCRT